MKIFQLLPGRSVLSLTRPEGTFGCFVDSIAFSPRKGYVVLILECIIPQGAYVRTALYMCPNSRRLVGGWGMNHCPGDEICDTDELCLSCITAPRLQTSPPSVFVSLVGFHDHSSKRDSCFIPLGINPGLSAFLHLVKAISMAAVSPKSPYLKRLMLQIMSIT